jgi:hypothetical protein
MGTIKQTENMEKDVLILTLTEILEEQKNTNQINTNLITAVNQLTTKVNSFNEKLEKQKIVAPTINTEPIQAIVKKGLIDMKLTVSAQPKNVIREFQVLLFPEQDARLFYKIVFGRWFMWLAIMLFFTFLYKWAVHNSDNNKDAMIEALKNDKIIKSWNYLYDLKSRNLHRLMDSAMTITTQDHK